TVSGNSVSGNAVSGNSLEQKKLCASYEETIKLNHQDKLIIAGSEIDFSDKKIVCLGDSITEASNLNNMENYQQMSYPYQLGQILGAGEVVNLGIGGSSIGRYWDNAFVDRYQEIPLDADIIIVMGGTNDGFCASLEELGSMEERRPETFAGDLDELLRNLKENYPDAQIVLATPLSNVLHDILRKDRDYLLPQSAFAGMMKQLAAEYEIPVVDLYHSNFLNSHDAAIIYNFIPDGVHGNEMGYRMLAEHFAAELIRLAETEKETEGVDENES
ncbi:MAG: SGNH/GDSL hydrolase family protein, partial [Lachnospiraceae bacterium]|nr:SGNH/GDSL hydrolase family protein [Lachnospiraceae bacterium]